MRLRSARLFVVLAVFATRTETGASSVDVTGTYVHVDRATIAVNGVPATTTALSGTSGTFRATASLSPGLVNAIVAGGHNHAGVEARDTVDVQHVSGAPCARVRLDAETSPGGTCGTAWARVRRAGMSSPG